MRKIKGEFASTIAWCKAQGLALHPNTTRYIWASDAPVKERRNDHRANRWQRGHFPAILTPPVRTTTHDADRVTDAVHTATSNARPTPTSLWAHYHHGWWLDPATPAPATLPAHLTSYAARAASRPPDDAGRLSHRASIRESMHPAGIGLRRFGPELAPDRCLDRPHNGDSLLRAPDDTPP